MSLGCVAKQAMNKKNVRLLIFFSLSPLGVMYCDFRGVVSSLKVIAVKGGLGLCEAKPCSKVSCTS